MAPRKDLAKDSSKKESKTTEKAAKITKRTHSDVESSDLSMNTSVDCSELTKDLQDIKNVMKENTSALKEVVKKTDIEQIVTNIVQKLLDNFRDEIRKEFNEQIKQATESQLQELEKLKADFEQATQSQSQEIEKLKADIVRLTKKGIDQHMDIDNLRGDIDYTFNRVEEVTSMANYNEQYSRKSNIKIMNFKVDKEDNLKENFVKMVKDDLKVNVEKTDVIAIHRLKKIGTGVAPVIVKVINSDIKTKIMRNRKMTKGNVRLYDDITSKNRDLYYRLKDHKDIETAYFFNCYIYGRTTDGLKIRFDIHDDIQSKIDFERRKE